MDLQCPFPPTSRREVHKAIIKHRTSDVSTNHRQTQTSQVLDVGLCRILST